jgi:hypothetical protein
MRRLVPVFLVAITLCRVDAQSQAPSAANPAVSNESTRDSPVYPIGDAIPVYRAVLDLLYLDGSRRPSVIIIRDTTGAGFGAPCHVVRCSPRRTFVQKAKIDSTTVLAFVQATRKHALIRPFGYPVPIVFLSDDEINRLDADGREFIRSHPMPVDLPKRSWGSFTELQRKYPGSWGLSTFTEVGFNDAHTEALVQVRQMCSDDCRVDETLVLKNSKGRWRVVERIPARVDRGYSPYGRYLGPIGTTPEESELTPVERPGVPYEAAARDDVYRAVIDSLYSVNNERPKRIVLTNWFRTLGDLPTHTSAIDPALVKKFAILGAVRAPFDAISSSRFAISTLPLDSVPALRERGKDLDVENAGYPFWLAFTRKFPDAWGMLGVSRIAFNADRSHALVNTSHACGTVCVTVDTWFLRRSGKKWRIAERIPGERHRGEVEPARYIGVDVSPIAFRPRRVQGTLTDAASGKAIPGFTIRVRRFLVSGLTIDDPSLRTDSLGRFTLKRLPLSAEMTLVFECPNGSSEGRTITPIRVTAGMDTTITTSFSLAACNHAPPDAGAQELLSHY